MAFVTHPLLAHLALVTAGEQSEPGLHAEEADLSRAESSINFNKASVQSCALLTYYGAILA